MTSSVRAEDRQYVVDPLRGFALLGVLLVNTPFLLTSVAGATDASMPTGFDRAAGFLTWTFFQAKSYVVFSFLFGYSLAILLDRVEARGQNGGRVYAQRLGALFLIGAVHAVVLFVGDILVLYAVAGAAMLWLRRKGDRALLRVAAGLFVAQILLLLALFALPVEDDTELVARIDRAWREGGFVEATLTRLEVWPFALGLILAIQGLLVAALFCVGLVCGRRGVLADPERHRPVLLRIRRWGYLLGLPPQIVAGVLAVWPGIDQSPARQALSLLLMYPTAPLLSAAYVATIALLPRRGFARAVEADGTMSLSIYLGESLLMTTLAAGWGFGLFGRTTGVAFVIALAVWFALLGFAMVWHRRLGTGPAERLLRRLTYAGTRRDAGRRAPAASGSTIGR